jgi:proteic killer suppression protein
MIRRFRHRGLKRLYEDDDHREVNPQHADKIARMLARLDQATEPAISICQTGGCTR